MALDLFRVDGGLQIEGLSQITAGVGAPTHDAEVGSTYHRVDGAGGLYVKTAPGAGSDKWELQAAKSYVDTEIANVQASVLALGNALNYVGTVAGGSQSTPFDLATLPANNKDAGDYFKVSTSGWFVVGSGTAFYANAGDGLVWNTTGGVDIIDNTNLALTGEAGYLDVSGSADLGYSISIAQGFKDQVSNNAVAINDETTARINADAALQASIDAETTARINADTTLQANIDAETTARINADSALQSSVTALSANVDHFSHTTTASAVTSASDSIAGAKVAKWIVYVNQSSTPTNANAFEIFAMTNGTTVDFNRFSILKIGSPISGLNSSVSLAGGALTLSITSGVNVDVIIRRVSVV